MMHKLDRCREHAATIRLQLQTADAARGGRFHDWEM